MEKHSKEMSCKLPLLPFKDKGFSRIRRGVLRIHNPHTAKLQETLPTHHAKLWQTASAHNTEDPMSVLRSTDGNTASANNSKNSKKHKRGYVNLAYEEFDNENGERFMLSFGKKGNDVCEFQDAKNITCMSSGRLLITDFILNRLQICTKSYPNDVATITLGGLERPWATTMTNDNNIAVTICNRPCVEILNPNGHLIKVFGENVLLYPTGIAVDSFDRFFVCDSKAGHVVIFDSAGNHLGFLGNSDNVAELFSNPHYICVSAKGDIIVSDSGKHSIQIFDSNWNFVKSVGSFGKGTNQFKSPYGVSTDKHGDIFVADHYNNRVSIFTRKGAFVRHILTSENGIVHPQGITVTSEHMFITHGHLKACEILIFRLAVD